MGYSYNHGLVTPNKGIALVAARVSDLHVSTGENCTLDEDGSGFINAVEHDASGVYIVKLKGPYPPRLVAGFVQLSAAATTTDLLTARLDSGSYDADTGWLTINVSNDDDSGAPLAADGLETDELHLILVFARYTVV
jgi:hypothetical protein